MDMTNHRRAVSAHSESTEAEERDALRALRIAIGQETEQIRRDFDSAHGGRVVEVLLTMNARLQQHNEALTHYYVRLEAFHRRYGPLGR